MSKIFKAKTLDGVRFKVLIEILHSNYKTASFRITNEGIFLRMFDTNMTRLIDITLNKDKFNYYKFILNEEKFIGFNLDHLNKMMKSVKKNDSIVLYILKDIPNELFISVESKENRTKKSVIQIKTFEQQNIYTELPTGYNKTINISSNDFQKVCKEFSSISSTIKISSKNFLIKFASDGGNIYSRQTTFGEADDSDSEDDSSSFKEYEEEFDSDNLVRISKIASLNTEMQIFIDNTKKQPIMFKSSIGNIGTICIFIKSKMMIDRDNN